MHFNPHELMVMQGAFGSAEKALRFAFPSGLDGATREQLAKAIIEAASDREIDQMLLCMTALRKLEPRAAA